MDKHEQRLYGSNVRRSERNRIIGLLNQQAALHFQKGTWQDQQIGKGIRIAIKAIKEDGNG